MGSWNYSDLAKAYRLESLKNIPKFSHFALMIVEQRSYSEAGYNPGDRSEVGYYDNIDYYAFPIEKKNLWEKLISDIYAEMHTDTANSFSYRSKPEIIFFKSSGRGEVDVKINVNVEIKE